MDIMEAIAQRHSVRQYLDKPFDGATYDALNEVIAECNGEGDLHIQLVTDEEKAFSGMLARYGSFRGVKNYIALIGKNGADLCEKLGYYGEKIVLAAQMMGLNTCWVALTYKKVKKAYTLGKNEKLLMVIAVGYGAGQGKSRKSKAFADVTEGENLPEWFIKGAEAALLAPTAMNQQKFKFVLTGENNVHLRVHKGVYTEVDAGIVKYHFEQGAGKENFNWV